MKKTRITLDEHSPRATLLGQWTITSRQELRSVTEAVLRDIKELGLPLGPGISYCFVASYANYAAFTLQVFQFTNRMTTAYLDCFGYAYITNGGKELPTTDEILALWQDDTYVDTDETTDEINEILGIEPD